MVRIALTSFRRTPQLNHCDARTIFAAVLTAAQFGWEIGIHAFLVPYKNTKSGTMECQLVPGWQGLTDLASRSGRASVWTGAVYEGDKFDYALGDSPHVRHQPLAVEETADKLTHVYAVGRTTGAAWPVIEVWPVKKVKAHRDKYNKQGNKHYSFEHLEMYGRKVALLQVLKYMPKSAELQTAIEIDHEAERGEKQNLNPGLPIDTGEIVDIGKPEDFEDFPGPKEKSTTEALKDKLKGKQEQLSSTEVQEAWPKKDNDEKLPF
jgi:recombination protein RecT